MKLAAAATLITLLLAPPVWAERPLSDAQLPKSGVAKLVGGIGVATAWEKMSFPPYR